VSFHSKIWTAVVLIGGLTGCSSGSGLEVEETVPVSGTATFQGKPLPGYLVTFVPNDGRRSAGGLTDDQGKFILGTNESGDGCPPGPCKISVVWGGPPQEEPGQEVLIDDPRKRPKQPIDLPQKFADPAQSGLEVVVPEEGLENYTLAIE
jgi:hypothetical protein